MTCLAAWPLGISVAVLGQADEPAAGIASELVVGDWNNGDAVASLGGRCSVVTLENEFVNPAHLDGAAAAGAVVRPAGESLARIQDKAAQKTLITAAGLPVARHVVVTDADDLGAAGCELGWPLVLKRRRLGYDGYGNATCQDEPSARGAFARLAQPDGLLAEAWVPFAMELAVMVARRPGGESVAYPVTQTIQRDHVCRTVIAPAPVPVEIADRAAHIALAVADAADGIGVTGVELFLLGNGELLVNELAPRPHNSGHYSIEACETSQFENHLRGVLDLPLGAVTLRAPAAVMVNILGTRSGVSRPRLADAVAIPGAHIHLYGKRETRVRRKMGHVTVLGTSVDDATARAEAAAEAVAL